MIAIHLTVGGLRKAIEGLPDDAEVYYQRIEDVYFEKHGWTTRNQGGDMEYPDAWIPAFGVCKFKDDKNLYITAHY